MLLWRLGARRRNGLRAASPLARPRPRPPRHWNSNVRQSLRYALSDALRQFPQPRRDFLHCGSLLVGTLKLRALQQRRVYLCCARSHALIADRAPCGRLNRKSGLQFLNCTAPVLCCGVSFWNLSHIAFYNEQSYEARVCNCVVIISFMVCGLITLKSKYLP